MALGERIGGGSDGEIRMSEVLVRGANTHSPVEFRCWRFRTRSHKRRLSPALPRSTAQGFLKSEIGERLYPKAKTTDRTQKALDSKRVAGASV